MKDGTKTMFQEDWHGAEPSFNPGAYVDIDVQSPGYFQFPKTIISKWNLKI